MSLLINLTPTEEAQLSAAATQTGLAPEAFAEKLVREHLPTVSPMEEMRRRLREWQRQDNTPLSQPVPPRNGLTPTAALFEQWADEDARMTDTEREADDRLWEDFQKGIDAERRNTGMRTLF